MFSQHICFNSMLSEWVDIGGQIEKHVKNCYTVTTILIVFIWNTLYEALNATVLL